MASAIRRALATAGLAMAVSASAAAQKVVLFGGSGGPTVSMTFAKGSPVRWFFENSYDTEVWVCFTLHTTFQGERRTAKQTTKVRPGVHRDGGFWTFHDGADWPAVSDINSCGSGGSSSATAPSRPSASVSAAAPAASSSNAAAQADVRALISRTIETSQRQAAARDQQIATGFAGLASQWGTSAANDLIEQSQRRDGEERQSRSAFQATLRKATTKGEIARALEERISDLEGDIDIATSNAERDQRSAAEYQENADNGRRRGDGIAVGIYQPSANAYAARARVEQQRARRLTAELREVKALLERIEAMADPEESVAAPAPVAPAPSAPRAAARAFAFDGASNDGGGTRRDWVQVSPTVWLERYPNGATTRFEYVSDATVNGVAGVAVLRMPDRGLFVFIPNSTPPGTLYWGVSGGGWQVLANARAP